MTLSLPPRFGSVRAGRLPSLLVGALLAIVLALLATRVANAQTNEIGLCAQYRPGAPQNFNCTANDAEFIAQVVGGPAECVAGDDVTIQVQMKLDLNASQRYDLGFYMALDGTSPVNGSSCWLRQFSTASPFKKIDADNCGDSNVNIPFFTLPDPITVACTPGPTGKLSLPIMSFWDNNQGSTCTNVPGTGSKCSISYQEVNVTVVGELTVIKEARPRDGANFNFTTSGAVVRNFTLDDELNQTDGVGNTYVMTVPIPPGGSSTVTVTETLPDAAWRNVGVSCGGAARYSGRALPTAGTASGSVTLTADNPTATCKFVNEKNAQVVVKKETQPNGAPGSFPYLITGGADALNISGNLSDGDSFSTGYTLKPGPELVTVSEPSVPAGWLKDPLIYCVSAVNPRAVLDPTFSLLPGDTVTCTITNVQAASVQVTKNVVGGAGAFTFDLSNSSPKDVLASDGSPGSALWTDLEPGNYTMSEAVSAGQWETSDFACDIITSTGATTVTGPPTGVQLTITPGASATCEITNTALSQIVVAKQTNPPFATDLFKFAATGGPNALAVGFALIDGEAYTITALYAGTYAITETVPAGWALDSLTCDDGSPADAIAIDPGETVTCTAVNSQLAQLRVVKESLDADGNPVDATFDFDASPAPLGSFSITTTGGLGIYTAPNIPAGSYTITETVPPGWRLDGVTCLVSRLSDFGGFVPAGSGPGAITLLPGRSGTCTFRNVQLKPEVKIVKTVTVAGDATCADAEDFITVLPNTPIRYCFTVINTGEITLTNVTVTDPNVSPFPAPLASLPPGDEWNFSVPATATGPLVNTATVNTDEGATDSDTAEVVIADALLDIDKAVGPAGGPYVNNSPGDPLVVDTGDSLEWQWLFSNPGSVTQTLTITDLLNGADYPITCQEGALPSKLVAGGVFTCTVSAPFPAAPGLNVNVVTVEGCTVGTTPIECALFEDDAAYITRPQLTVTKIVDNQWGGGLQPGDFPLNITGNRVVTPLVSGVPITLNPGIYDVSEKQQPGYTSNGFTGDCGITGLVRVQLGGTYACEITNTDLPAELVVIKEVIGEDPPGQDSFEILVDGLSQGSVTGPLGKIGPINVVSGTHVVAEVLPNTSWVSTISGDCDAQGNVTTTNGKTSTCLIENKRKGRIGILKDTSPGDSTQAFLFDASWSLTPVSVGAGQIVYSPELTPGQYSLVEQPLPGWYLGGAACDDGSKPGKIKLSAGETVICTFHNVQQGKIVIAKETDPGGSAQSFDFTSTWGESFSLKDGEVHTSPYLSPGEYKVTESLPAGWRLADVVCSDQASGADTIFLSPGETVTCAFLNTIERGEIVLVKETDPDQSLQEFIFDTSFGGAIVLTDGAFVETFNLLPSSEAGPYSVSEQLPPGWTLTSAGCDNGGQPSNIDLQPGQTVVCTFNNAIQRATLVVTKQTNPAIAPTALRFPFIILGGVLDAFALGNGETFTRTNLIPSSEAGLYGLFELVPLGWELTSILCSNGDPAQALDLQPNETVQCDYLNTKLAKVVVKKVVIPATDSTRFLFNATSSDSFTLTHGTAYTVTGVSPTRVFTVAEAPNPLYNLVSATCDNGNPPSNVAPAPGSTVTCTFTNSRLPGVLGNRVWEDLNSNGLQDANEPGIPNVVMSVYPVTVGASAIGPRLAQTTTNAQGEYTFAVPDGSYQVGLGIPAGYTVTTSFVGSDPTIDSNFDAAGLSDVVAITAGVVDDTIDAGLFVTPTADDDVDEPNASKTWLPVIGSR